MLNDRQKEAVEHGEGPLLMAAGAGSGKTRALTSRLRFLIERGTAPERIVAITFTNKAADQMYEQVFNTKKRSAGDLPTIGKPFIGTFHSFGLRILKNEIQKTDRRPGFSIYDDDDSSRMVRHIIKELDLPREHYRPAVLKAKISRIKSELQNPEMLKESSSEEDQILYEAHRRYEEKLEKSNAFDFDDLIAKTILLLQKNPEVLKQYQDLFDYVLVDEYQDINRSQYELVRLLVKKHQNLNVVGDDAQSIYRFRGADYRNFLNFARDWPNAKIVKLEQAYRSTKTIIAAANALIANNTKQTPKTLWTDNASGEPIQVISAGSQEDEALWLASEIQALRRKHPKQSVAVLYRTNAQSRAVEQALLQYGISYKIFGGPRFYDRKEVKDVVAALRFTVNPFDQSAKERIETSLGKRRSAPFFNQVEEGHIAPNSLGRIEIFLDAVGYKEWLKDKYLNAPERLENISELISFALQYDENPEELLERISLLQASDKIDDQISNPDVLLMTVHISKGLEFDTVFVIGLSEGILPHEKSMLKSDEVEEERRLMYVAITRAKNRLYFSYFFTPSRFLYEIPDELCQFQNSDGRDYWLPDEDEMYID
ncbi:MAG: ATP-dependent DNA helicase PcrA [Candidatus Harrisonbacteria bacterium CG10_big_fil_rev_8_21_14_0_10_44_23]|uniref:DNA 3'-5' helicase n=1 Tax=Candidatus Harrisonbacteria bacterium CG10_big_fil_rev_8_21_14_0_10_44_23 TaxID=1974585 RepID=A0A2H0UQW3_9BACT|nr:MAG: ATP-dependent DNA helicase PcrA [Candidatus Harrisonbacteria bacterium CG10_big_fil_rev_8_21_14_0_10_44_23]